MNNFDLTVLSFDEVKIAETIEYSHSLDKDIVPFKQMQVVFTRGLLHQWKQPIYLAFDEPMKKEILFQCISEVEKQGGKSNPEIGTVLSHREKKYDSEKLKCAYGGSYYRIRLLMLGKQAELSVPNDPVKCRSTNKEAQDMPPLNQLEPTSISNF
ncbi:unnamed protein product [Lepeophtheirus salmonis]|uniref:(salmon louse) hypothetical protein n=1 Tax=Lepeophtheirus salmonis TaxID=72036 RepID=A0A7R8H386_LEPSM|nr:unnamed protein product [Lepeophtheirus salmonis]CAF2838567.1 unnamed protein product [Lepeophtheirus salmonis]